MGARRSLGGLLSADRVGLDHSFSRRDPIWDRVVRGRSVELDGRKAWVAACGMGWLGSAEAS